MRNTRIMCAVMLDTKVGSISLESVSGYEDLLRSCTGPDWRMAPGQLQGWQKHIAFDALLVHQGWYPGRGGGGASQHRTL